MLTPPPISKQQSLNTVKNLPTTKKIFKKLNKTTAHPPTLSTVKDIIEFISKPIENSTSERNDVNETTTITHPNKKMSHVALAQYLVDNFKLMRDDSHLYLYNNKKGYYELLNDGIGSNTFDSFVRTNIPEIAKMNICTYDISEAMKWLVSDAMQIKQHPKILPRYLVAFKNGTLHLPDMSLQKHSPKNNLTIGVNANYIADSEKYISKTTFWRFINRLSGYDDTVLKVLRIVVGLSLSNIRNLKRIFYVVGISNNGKSVFGDLILKLLPPNSYSALEIADLSDRFSKGILYGKHINLSSDENTSTWPSSSVSFLKKAVAGDVIKGENKYQPPFEFRCRALFLCLSNGLPCYKEALDAGGAISKRLFIIPTTNTPITDEEEDFQILDKMLYEKDIIASWSIDSVSDIVKTGILPEKIIESKPQEFYLEFDRAFQNWSEATISYYDKNAQTTSSEFFKSFKEYADKYNVMYNEKAFYMKLAEKYKPYKRHNKKSYYIGLSIVHNDNSQIDYQGL